MGPAVPALVQEDARRGGLGRTHGHQEEEDHFIQEGHGAGYVSIQADQVDGVVRKTGDVLGKVVKGSVLCAKERDHVACV